MLKLRSTALTTEYADIIAACELPEEYDASSPDDVHGWLAENAVEFFNEAAINYQMAIQNNEGWKKLCHDPKRSGFPIGVLYLWKENSSEKAVTLPADEYVSKVFNWIESVINDEDIFPPDEDTPWPENFRKYLKKMFSRLFRVYIIIRANDCLRNHTDKAALKASLCLFLYFGWHWELLPFEDPGEAKSINKIMEPIRARYLKEQEKKPKKKSSQPPQDV